MYITALVQLDQSLEAALKKDTCRHSLSSSLKLELIELSLLLVDLGKALPLGLSISSFLFTWVRYNQEQMMMACKEDMY